MNARRTMLGLALIVSIACNRNDEAPAGFVDHRPADPDPERTAVTNVVLRDVLPQGAAPAEVVVLAVRRPLDAGVEVREYSNPDGPSFVTTAPTWLYFVDDDPGALFGHAVRWVFVDAASKRVLAMQERAYWPLIDGQSPLFPTPADLLVFSRLRQEGVTARRAPLDETTAIAHGGSGGAELGRTRQALRRDPPCPGNRQPRCFWVLFAGGTAGDPLAENMRQDLQDWGAAVRRDSSCELFIREIDASTDTTPTAHLSAAIAEVQDMAECCDRVNVLVSSHGQRRATDAMGNMRLVRQGDTVGPGETAFWTIDAGADGALTLSAFAGAIRGMRSCHVSFINGACYSGGSLRELDGLANVQNVIASTDEDETRQTGGGWIWELSRRHGTTYLQTLLREYERLRPSASGAGVDATLEQAVAPARANDPFVQEGQDDPKNSVRPADAECPCCGDGTIDTGEGCDDGNRVSMDGCDAMCASECGNGSVDGSEECDDGNTDAGDGCDPSCMRETPCGDGTLDDGEECDDGNRTSGDGCDDACLTEACGNGRLEGAEQCDDGNTDAGDGCDDACLAEEATCGDGRVEGAEQCDDGNTDSGDGCDATCRREGAGCPSSDYFSCCYLSCDAGGGLACLDPCNELCSPFTTGSYDPACVAGCGPRGTEVWAMAPSMAEGCEMMRTEGMACADGCRL